jgi:hypothetical protein
MHLRSPIEMRDPVRLVIATASTPLVTASVLSVSTVLKIGGGPFSVLGLLPIYYVTSLVAEVTLGLPMCYIGLRLKLVRWWSAAISGVLAGSVAALALSLPHVPTAQQILFMGSLGASSGLVFWATWRFEVPRRSAF